MGKKILQKHLLISKAWQMLGIVLCQKAWRGWWCSLPHEEAASRDLLETAWEQAQP
jgi:hypothetical protein